MKFTWHDKLMNLDSWVEKDQQGNEFSYFSFYALACHESWSNCHIPMLHMIKALFFCSPVETEHEALVKGESLICTLNPGRNLERYIIKVCTRDDDEWHVYYVPKGPDGLPEYGIKGGGGPSVSIRKSNGRITNYTPFMR